MSLIIKDKIQMMMKGFPTVSDKYNVLPAVLDGDAPVDFGDVVDGIEVVDKIAATRTGANARPLERAIIARAYII